MKKINVKLTKDLEVEAVVIREFEAEEASYYHQILYCQNRLIEYTKFVVNKISKDPYQTPEDIQHYYESLINNNKYFLLNETEEHWEFATIDILAEHCVISD